MKNDQKENNMKNDIRKYMNLFENTDMKEGNNKQYFFRLKPTDEFGDEFDDEFDDENEYDSYTPVGEEPTLLDINQLTPVDHIRVLEPIYSSSLGQSRYFDITDEKDVKVYVDKEGTFWASEYDGDL